MNAIQPSAPSAVTGTFIRNAWYCALWAESLPADKPVGCTILNEPVVLFRRADGSAAAILDRCAHRFAPLSMGKIVGGDRLQCPYHGLEYDGSGACVRSPYGPTAPAGATLRSFPVQERHKILWVWMGERAADPALIPDFSILDDADPVSMTICDSILVRANYELIVDNLLDLSHTAFLHDGLLGSPEIAAGDIKLEQEGDRIIVSRFSRGAPMPGMFALTMPNAPALVDKWNWIRWMAPSTLLLRSGVCLTDSDPETGTGYYGIHILTPEDERNTRYFFTAVRFNMLTEGAENNQSINAEIARLRRFAFAEQDGPVIEAQQRLMDRAGGNLAPTLLPIDAGPVRYRRVLERLQAADRAG
jgi:phenylpropionate dioxygenase-like ring-hydroxylating dioxygenase large terminal subunit